MRKYVCFKQSIYSTYLYRIQNRRSLFVWSFLNVCCILSDCSVKFWVFLEIFKYNIINIFGQCQFGAPIRNHRLSRIRTPITNTYRKKNNRSLWRASSNEGFIRRSHIIVLNKKVNSGIIILFKKIRLFEISEKQLKLVNEEKLKYCETRDYFQKRSIMKV